MKSIKDLREHYDLITEKEEHDMNKLTQLVRAGLFDAKKLSSLKRAMEKPADKMTAQEKRMLINLLDALMSEVLSDKQVYRKIKQDVMMKESKNEKKGMVAKDVTNIPAVILLKRKALRAFPDGQKVGLYYAQAIDKYVSIPFSEIGVSDVNEEINLEEGLWDKIKDFASNAVSSSSNTSSSKSQSKYYDPMSSKLATTVVGTGSKSGEDSGVSPALLSWERQRYRQSLQTEDVFDYEQRLYDVTGKVVPPLGIPPGYGRRRGAGSAPASKLSTKKYTGTGENLNSGARTSGPKRRIVPKRKDPRDIPQRDAPRRETPKRDPRDIPQREAPKRVDPNREDKPSRPPEKKPERRIDPNREGRPQPNRKPDNVKKTADDNKSQGQNANTGTRADRGIRTNRGTKAKRLAAAAAGLGILGSLASGAASAKDKEKKFTTPLGSKFKLTLADPKYSKSDAAVDSLERKLFRQSMMEEVELDGNIFELNNNTATKVKTLYESLNKKNKKKMLEMMKESDESLKKVSNFAISNNIK